ncbi:MAG: peptide deformylase [Thermoleophilia bacterium]|nr:peptide deformylase [Thermoleophilia bacterium]
MSAKRAFSKTETRKDAPLEQIRTVGDPVLRQQTKPVTVFDARLEKLAQVMMDVMVRGEGVGLAANQIGVVSRVLVWRNPENDEERYAWVNAVIVEESEARCTESEGCLSVPGATMEVSRAEEVVVECQDLAGEPLRVRLIGLPARIAQHEIDHLDGRLILDRTSPEERRRVMKELREQALAVET